MAIHRSNWCPVFSVQEMRSAIKPLIFLLKYSIAYWQAQPKRSFAVGVADVMMELLRVPKRNDIQREGKNQRAIPRSLFVAALLRFLPLIL